MNSRILIRGEMQVDLIRSMVLGQNQARKACLRPYKKDSNGHQMHREDFKGQAKGNSNPLINREINPDLLEDKRGVNFRMVTQIQGGQTDSKCRRLEDFVPRKADNFHQPRTSVHLNLPKADNSSHHQAGSHSLLPEVVHSNLLRVVVQEVFRLLRTEVRFNLL